MTRRAKSSAPAQIASGHLHARDLSGKQHYQSTETTSALAEEFEAAMARIGDLRLLAPPIGLLIALPAYEVVLTHSCVRRAAESYRQIDRHGEFAAIDWNLHNGWRDRRFLSEVSLDLLGSMSAPPSFSTRDWTAATKILLGALGDVAYKDTWKEFCRRASAWWSDRIPTLLWAHCARVERLQPLSRQTWARGLSKLPLATQSRSVALTVSRSYDAYLAAHTQTRQTGTLVDLEELVRDAASAHKSRAAFSEMVVSGATALLAEAVKEGRIQVLLVGFAIDLVENGGVLGQLSISAILGYVSQTVKRLFDELTRPKVDLNSLSGTGWWETYQSVIKAARPSQRGKVSATLHAFHDYLGWLGVPALPRGFGENEAARPPRAEVLWQIDGDRAIEWLILIASPNDRVNNQAQLIVMLIQDFMVRIEEVMSLRFGDILRTSAGLTLCVYPRISDGRIKADAVRRQQDIKSPELLRAMRAWLERREIEGAKPDDFLFGAPRKRRERFAHGQTYVLVEQALKIGSGEPAVSSHAARHCQGSEDGAAACMPQRSLVDINPIDQISSAAGQSVTQSLRETYMNIYEEPLLRHAQQAWKFAQASRLALPDWIRPIEESIELDTNGVWKTIKITARSTVIVLTDVLAAMEDMAADMTLEAISMRTGLSEDQLKFVLCSAAQAIESILPKAKRTYPGPDDRVGQTLVLMRHHALIASGKEAKLKPVLTWLSDALTQDADAAMLQGAFREWKPLVKNFHLSATEPDTASNLMELIRRSGIPRNRILISHATPKQSLHKTLLNSGWHLRPERAVRRGQPRVRLHICSVDASNVAAIDRAISNKGLYALLIAAEVRHLLPV